MNSPLNSSFQDLVKYSGMGKDIELEHIISKGNFSQEEMDEGLRECIKNFKTRNEQYINCIKIYLKNVPDINYQNKNHNNTTILMYCFEQGQEIPSELIISCFNSEIDVNIVDDANENCLIKLIKNNKMSEQTQSEFFSMLMSNKVDLNSKNNNEESILNLIEKKNKKLILEQIKLFVQNSKFEIEKYIDLYNKEEYSEILQIIKTFSEKEISYNQQFEFNKYLTEFKLIIKSINEKTKGNKNFMISSATNANFTDEYQYNIAKVLNEISCSSLLSNKKILLLNKLILYYQLDYFNNFSKLKGEIESNKELQDDKMLFFYNKTMFLEMLIDRGKLNQAKEEIQIFETNITYKINFPDINKPVYQNFMEKHKIFNIDNIKEVKLLIELYKILIMISEKEEEQEEINKNDLVLTSSKIKSAINLINALDITQYNCSKLLFLFYSFLNIHLIYYSSHFSQNKINYKLEKLLNLSNNNSTSSTFFEEDELTKIYYYNSYGILNLKNSNYSLAAFYFLKCLELIRKKTPQQIIKRKHYYPKVAFNLGLSYFYMKKYEQSIKIFKFLIKEKHKSFISTNRYIFFRLALAEIELWYSKNKNQINCIINEDVIEYLMIILRLSQDKKDDIYYQSYLNLIFTLITNKHYTQAIFILENIKLQPKKEHEYLLENYLIQCYIMLGRFDKANNIAENIILDQISFKLLMKQRWN